MRNNDILNLEEKFFFENAIENTVKRSTAHYHNSYEIYYLTNGTCWYFIDKKTYRLSKGDIALIPKGVIHKTNYDTQSHSRILINCSENFIPKSVLDLIPNMPYYTVPLSYRDKIYEIFSTVQKEFHTPNEFSKDIIKAKIYELLLFIANKNTTQSTKKIEDSMVEKAVKYIRNHFSENITLTDVAKHCFVSNEHLSRTFKKETGFCFNEYLNIYRLKKADLLLHNEPTTKITEIARRCGFNDSNYFSKVYKKEFNISPKQAK